MYTNHLSTRLEKGEIGTVQDITYLPESIGGQNQIWCKWESGSKLALIDGIDRFEIMGDRPRDTIPFTPPEYHE